MAHSGVILDVPYQRIAWQVFAGFLFIFLLIRSLLALRRELNEGGATYVRQVVFTVIFFLALLVAFGLFEMLNHH